MLHALAEAAAKCVGEGTTFADLSVERLARRAGISRASFYLYFEDRGELVRGWAHALDARTDTILSKWWDANSPVDDLVSQVLTELAVAYTDERFVVSAIQDMSALDPALREELDNAFQRRTTALRKHVARGQRAGWADSSLVAATTAPWLVAMIDRVMQQVVAGNQSDPALIETGACIIENTLYSL